MSEKRDDIDWSVTTWEGSRRAQLRHALTLTLRERLEAMEGLADVARRFQNIQGAFDIGLHIADGRDIRIGNGNQRREMKHHIFALHLTGNYGAVFDTASHDL